jgi:hypothetical protein
MTLTPTHEPIVITQYQVLLEDIEDAKKEQIATFAYETKEGDKAARSYLFQLRKLRARIESARKDAKAYALAYGKQLDNQAKELSSQVDELIEPHQEQLEAIARREAERVQGHRNVLQQIRDLAQVPFGSGANQIAMDLASAKDLDIDGLEEFKEEAAAALLETIRTLEAAHAKALADEAAAAELAKLKAEQQEREAKEKEERIKREAQEKADAEAAAAAFDAIAAAERRAAEAEAKVREAEAMAAQAELAKSAPVELENGTFVPGLPPIPQQEHGAFVVEVGPNEEEEAEKTARAMYLEELEDAVGPLPTEINKEQLAIQLLEAMKNMHRVEVVNAIVDGHLHPALQINWEAVK